MKAAKEMKSMPSAELVVKLEEFKKELLKLNVHVAAGTNPASPGKLKQLKKNIARVNMLLHQKEASRS